jgi:hypothetical protein
MIAAKNREGMALAALPYQIGIMAGVSAAMVSLPLVGWILHRYFQGGSCMVLTRICDVRFLTCPRLFGSTTTLSRQKSPVITILRQD